jgi:hypothetical protein
MLKRQFLLVIVIISMSLVSPIVSNSNSSALSSNPEAAGYVYRRNPVHIGAARASTAYHLDCFRRYYNFKEPAVQEHDASNSFMNLT